MTLADLIPTAYGKPKPSWPTSPNFPAWTTTGPADLAGYSLPAQSPTPNAGPGLPITSAIPPSGPLPGPGPVGPSWRTDSPAELPGVGYGLPGVQLPTAPSTSPVLMTPVMGGGPGPAILPGQLDLPYGQGGGVSSFGMQPPAQPSWWQRYGPSPSRFGGGARPRRGWSYGNGFNRLRPDYGRPYQMPSAGSSMPDNPVTPRFSEWGTATGPPPSFRGSVGGGLGYR